MHQKVTFDNKLRLITKPLDSTKAVTVLVLVGAGSRYETEEINGISHFLEHMFFKGAEKYGNTKEVSEAIDSVGGSFNAFTGKEYAGYYVKVAAENLELAIDVLSDMLTKAKLDPKEIDKERGVILEEYNMYQDTPMYQIGWAFERLIFGDQPIGRDQIGTKELISNVKQEQFKQYLNELYTPNNTVIGICGNFNPQKAKELVHQYFKMKPNKKAYNFDQYVEPENTEKIYLENKKTEQAHIVVGVPSVGQRQPETWVAKIISTILGGNMSSRMFLNVREAQGLAYYIKTSTDTYSDTGIISTRAGVDINRAHLAVKAIVEEYQKIANEGITDKELQKAKNYLKGKIVLHLEDSEEYAHMLCRQELLHSDIQTIDQTFKIINKITKEEVNKFAKKIFQEHKLHCAVIGPFKDKEKFAEQLTFS